MASRVITKGADGKDYVAEVLPAGGDVKKALRDTVIRLQVPVQEVRADAGAVVIQRWKPSIGNRFRVAWQIAWSS